MAATGLCVKLCDIRKAVDIMVIINVIVTCELFAYQAECHAVSVVYYSMILQR